ncbi:hypothetical protein JF50_13260 [Pseudoalteromonas luteoviolacea]|uniref:Uncharacterized protein n=1 Tax=Pseudoalteromonas luteoviolacea TaxID=43657 RepID=A0A0C1QBS0_9GAMM|nr:hypothetical protein [Pseudoalteromonas luteoviolacea]KID56860.1 hypothetical protein JF50_13260 [Pseudoalteromonas luteoviolacea]
MHLKPKTPKKINGRVKSLIQELNLDHKNSTFLRLTARDKSYRAGYCFNNCELESKKTGAKVVYGWQIWEDPKKSFIEAEFHAVIKENGSLLDISPRQTGEEKILFIEDSLRSSGRKSDDAWYSWTNLKMINGFVAETVKECEVVELDETYSELRILEG